MILSYGEILLDVFQNDKTGKKSAFVGGAPFNLICQAKKMNAETLFVGNVGNDAEGQMVQKYFKDNSIVKDGLRIDSQRKTTVSLVTTMKNGERSFVFHRDNTADPYFDKSSLEYIRKADIVHLGSLMLSQKEGFSFALEVIQKAKELHRVLSFDFNYREDVFSNKNEAIEIYSQIYPACDIIKLSEDELELFSEGNSIEERLMNFQNKPKLILVTLGKRGSLAYTNGKIIKAESIKVNPIDTTGAGDSFYGTFLASVDSFGLHEICFMESLLKCTLRFANVAGALSTTKRGALSSLPTYAEVEKELEKNV